MNDLSQAVTGFWEEIGIKSDLKSLKVACSAP